MASPGGLYSSARVTGALRLLLVAACAVVVSTILPDTSRAFPILGDRSHNPCHIAPPSSALSDRVCGWTFDSIARVEIEPANEADEMANLGRLKRIGFATSDLTIEESVAELASSHAALLSWDRQIGIADQLAASMNIAVDTGSLSSTQFLLMPATFNEAYLSDFVDFTACATAHTFIFSGALDGRSDAPYVTHRWQEMKVDVCLDIAGADCSRVELKVEPARLYFHGDWPCRYSPRRTSVEDGPFGG